MLASNHASEKMKEMCIRIKKINIFNKKLEYGLILSIISMNKYKDSIEN